MVFRINKILKKIIYFISLFAPGIVFAVSPGTLPTVPFFTVTEAITSLLNIIWAFFVGFAVVMFIVSGALFLMARGNMDKIAKARNAFLAGLAGVVVGLLSFSMHFIIRMSLGI